MSEPQPWVPLEGQDLLVGLRDILVANPERHDQSVWLGNKYADEEEWMAEGDRVPVDEIRRHMFTPPPAEPADSDAEVPPCGTTACAFGWAAILAAPSGSYIANGRVYFPDATSEPLSDWVAPRLGLDPGDAPFVYSTMRTREQLIAVLNARIDDPDADIRAAAGYGRDE